MAGPKRQDIDQYRVCFECRGGDAYEHARRCTVTAAAPPSMAPMVISRAVRRQQVDCIAFAVDGPEAQLVVALEGPVDSL